MKRHKDGQINIRFPIAFKLILIISVIVVFSLGLLTYLVSYFVGNDIRVTAEDNNHTVNTRSASAAETAIDALRLNVLLLLNLQDSSSSANELPKNSFFNHNNYVAAVAVPDSVSFINDSFFSKQMVSHPQSYSSTFLHTQMIAAESAQEKQLL